jgi:surface antigen
MKNPITMKNSHVLIALLLFATPAFALNMGAFRDAPITRLSQEELKAFSATILKTLDTTPDGVTVEWNAPKTTFSSKITPGRSVTDAKRTCRDATIESEAKDRFQRGTYSFCKTAKGQWQLRSNETKPDKK